MPLVDLPSLPPRAGAPARVRAFLRDATRRVERFRREHHLPAFSPSDYAEVYSVLRSLEEGGLLAGRWFCEWGSGLGVNTCLAAMLEFDAWGIEIEEELVLASRQLARDFDLSAEFVRGSYIPTGGDALLEAAGDCGWLTDVVGGGYEKMGLAPEDFDVIFAFPWPDEEGLTEALFERYARAGAVLMTYHEVDGFYLRRKVDDAGAGDG